jgi:hypothetical protein
VSYAIYKSDGTLLTTIADGTINTTSTSLGLPGRLYPGYGQIIDTDLVHILESSASSTPPNNPLVGQLWYNSANSTLNVLANVSNANSWQTIVTISTTSNITLGNLTVVGNLVAANANVVNLEGNTIVSPGNILANNITSNVNLSTYNLSVSNQATLTNLTTGSSSNTGTITGQWTVQPGSNINLTVPAANVVGTVANANNAAYAGNITVNSQPNINLVGTLGYLTVSGALSANTVTINVPTGNSPLVVYSNTKVSNLNADLIDGYNTDINASPLSVAVRDVNASMTANFFYGNGLYLTGVNHGVQPSIGYGTSNINIANADANITVSVYNISNVAVFNPNGLSVSNNLTANTITGTLTTANQSNITTVGTLGSLTVSGNITSGNANLGNTAQANYFSGNGYYLTNLNIAGYTVANANNANYAGTVTGNSQSNITSLGTLISLNVVGNITGGIVSGNHVGNGAGLSNITGANVTGQVNYAAVANSVSGSNVSGNVAAATLAGSAVSVPAANITGVVAFANIANTANIVPGSNVSGPVSSANNATYLNGIVGSSYLLANGTGSLLTSINGSNVSGPVANATYATNAGNAVNATNATNATNANIASLATTANYAVTAGSAGSASTVTSSFQPNITGLGTLSTLSVTGTASANTFSGSGAGLTNINGGNVNGEVANAVYADNAGNATNANNANSASSATSANYAVNSGYATNAGNATNATNATNAGYATVANTVNNISGTQVTNALGYTPIGISSFPNSLTANGWQILPGGLIMQWGYVNWGTNPPGNWNFVNYSKGMSVLLSIHVTKVSNHTDNGVVTATASQIAIGSPTNPFYYPTTSGFYYSAAGGNCNGFYWFAIGYQ